MERLVCARREFARWAGALAVGLLCATAACSKPTSSDRLEIVTQAGIHRVFHVEIAVTPQQRETGLMYRQTLAPDAGMLFDFQSDQMVEMWMANTYVSLDMLFISRDGTIVKIAADTVPLSRAVISSGSPVRAVLEIKGGEAARQGIAAGDTVHHPMFSNAN
ncbi:MAG TPA: DUF192 domain-containing protein [Thermomicrobiales bacterium]|nr:DUF192 domain-containing protein [Thermomicrobiales bacterium]